MYFPLPRKEPGKARGLEKPDPSIFFQIFQEQTPMKIKSIFTLIASAILITGVVIAGCTQSSASVSQQPDNASGISAVQTLPTYSDNQIRSNDRPAFNSSWGPNSSSPSGMRGNRTRPSGTPPEGMMNGTFPPGLPPSGTPPSGSQR